MWLRHDYATIKKSHKMWLTGGTGVLQLFAVAGDNPSVPIKTLFARTLERAGTVVVFVDVDKTVAFAVFPGGEGDTVDTAPRGVTDQINPVVDHGFFHLFDMCA